MSDPARPLGRCRWSWRPFALAAASLVAAACGGAAPTLHPAHVLPEGRVSAGAGVSGQFIAGQGARALSRSTAPDDEQRFLEAAAAEATFAPGIAPWVAARVGLGGHTEGGLTYSGRSARVDARHAFGDETVALSVGAGASALLMHPGANAPGTDGPVAGRFTGSSKDLAAQGFGLDVPILVGWRSSAQIVQAWAGARAGFDHTSGELALAGDAGVPADVGVTRWFGGGLVGLAVGVSPVWVALQLDVAYQSLSGEASFPDAAGAPDRRSVTVSGVSIAPAGALLGKF